jgi:hypothetical protein
VIGDACGNGPVGACTVQMKLAASPGRSVLTESGVGGPAVHPDGSVNRAATSLALGLPAGTRTVALAVNVCPAAAASGTFSDTVVPGGVGMAYCAWL